jgi:hypothetical protein
MNPEKNMISFSEASRKDTSRVRTTQEIITDYRTRLALADEARAQQRRLDLAEQCLESNPPETRIGTWEKLHGLRMPADPEHPILDVIADTTHLRLSDVHAVQAARRRKTLNAASTASSDAESQAASVIELDRGELPK